MSKGSKYTVQNQIYLITRMLKELKVQYIVYSCELNDSKSESDEVHTLELPLLMFITLSTT